MEYTVAIIESEEGFTVSVPGLPECVSQGDTEQKALANIEAAISEYSEIAREIAASKGARFQSVKLAA